MMIEKLEWDSSFFGYNVGRINIQDVSSFDLELLRVKAKDFKLVYIFSDEIINTSDFLLVDKKVIYHQNIKDAIDDEIHEISDDIAFTSFDDKVHDIEILKRLSLQSGVYSRFSVDKNFCNNEYEKLYLKWIENSVNKIISFDIVIALHNNIIVGFSTLNKKNENLVDIGLVAVSDTHRGLGIGKKLINESISKSQEMGFYEIQVVTQLDNIPANNLYKSTKFKIQNLTNIYHFWNI